MSGSDATRIQEGFSSLCHDGHGEGSQLADDENPELVPFPIAIVGMSMRLPGGVRSEKELWEMLINKRDGRCTVPEDRYNIEAFCDDARPGSIRTKHGYFLQQDISQVDAAFFGMSAIEAAKLDPQQRILLEVIWECLENSGQVPAKCRGKNIGCYVGVFGEDWLDLMSKDTQAIDRFRVVSAADFALSNRISYEYDLRGPSITYRTGCSSALVGLHEACQALYTGECTSALVAGSNLIITPTTSTAMSETMALAPDGISKTFDAAADGYGRGEAVNAIYIKPLHACLRDGDPIRAVIRSTAVNCDGRTTSITTPGSQAQEALIRRAYQKAGIDELAQTAFFECHGTGTIVGDTAETSVIAKVFGQDGIHIGAVKPNLGHSEGASGITSVIKSVLSLEQRTIPPNIHFNNPNPKISFKEAKLQVPVHPTSWPAGRCERISINSFGIGGTNAHLILDSAHSVCREPIPKGLPNEKPSQHILLASAKSETALENSINTIKDYVAAAPDSVSDLAYTLAYKREHLQHRAFAIVEKDGGALTFEKSRAFYPQVCFVFTGQGAQWPGMGKEMITRSMSFRLAIQKLDKELQGLEDPPDWKIEDKLLNADNSSEFKEARFAQPLCTAIQLALVDVLRDVGVVPSVVVGHSSGEIAAAYASGALNAATAIKIAYCRGLAMESLSVHGTMAAIGLGRAEIEQYLRDGAVLACENSQDNVTISGNTDAVEAVINEIGAKDDVFCRRLAVEVAYHSHHMKEAGQSFETLLSGISFNKSMTPLVSTVTNETISDPKVLDPAYWRKNVESPVLFHTAVQKILQRDKQAKVFLEIGPHSTLSGPLRQNISHADAGKTCFYTPTLIRGKDQWRCWLATIGQLHSLGTPVDIASTICRGKTLTDLPPYSWDHNESYWTETRLTRDWRLRQAPHHELLGTRTLESSDLEPVWRNMLQLDNVTWIMEHMLGGEIVFPGAGYVAMAGEAIQQITGVSAYSVRNMSMRTALSLKKTDTVPTEILTSLRPVKLTDYLDAAWYEFSIVAHQDGVWRKHCVGQVRAEPDEPDAGEPVVSYARKIASDEWYNALELRGFEYGPRFRRLREITASPTTLEATAALSDVDQPNGARYTLHPVMIDQCLQLFSVACAQGVKRRMTQLCIPSGIEGLYVAKGHKKMFLKAGCDTAGSTMTGNSSLVADDGSLVLDLKRCLLFGITDSALLDGKCGPSAGTLRLEPHINFAAPDTLLPPVTLSPEYAKLVTEGTRLFIVEAYHRTRSARPTKEYLKKYHQWLFRTYKKIELEEPDLVPEMKDIPASDPRSRLAKLQAIDDIIETPLARSIFNAMRDVFSSIEDILNEQKSGLEVIMDSEAVAGVYEHSSRLCDLNRFMSLLCHSKPNLRILEVGAGTGGTTAVALEALSRVTSHMVPMYGSYTFTDISAGFFNNAKERFKEYSGIRYETFDITRDPEEQGFSARAYDLIIASNVVHATPSKSQTLRNLRSLLAPGGWLFLTELCPSVISIQFIMGVLPGWWAAEDSTTDPTISTAQWHHELLEAGFTGTDVARTATDPRYEFNAYILSRRPREPAPVAKEINFLHGDTIPSWARTLEHAFLDIGCHVQWFTVHSLPPSASDIISLIELDRPFFHDLSKEGFETFKSIVSRIRGHCLWLMRPVQFHHNNFDPRFALTLGMMRVLRKEVAAKFTTLELDQHDCNATKNVVWVLEEVRRHNHQLEMDVDYEYVLKEGAINVGRYHFDHLHQVVPTSQNFESRSLDIGCLGILDSLTWALDGRVQAPGEREVEVDIHFVGVNFRDVMVSMGLIGVLGEIGLEATGIVRNVGSKVTSFQPGDRVGLFGKGLMGTRKIVPEHYCFFLPEVLSLEDAATAPCIFATANYSLITCGNLQPGQSVLIHSACGGVGLAAIQISQMVGAEIFATVGNPEKKAHLIENCGIDADHIFDSRSVSFEKDVMRMTGNKGVDLVLNSLSGELLHASWRCVAPLGKMVELGKRDFLGHAKLDMDLFNGNRTFYGVDLLQLSAISAPVLQKTIYHALKCLQEGKLRPVRPVKVFPAKDIAQAFRYMHTGKHMGRIVIQMPESPHGLPATKVRNDGLILRSDASYLLAGGLGGLGRAVARWMLEKGARHLIFMSRSGLETPKSREFVQDLESQGECQITVITGDVANMEDVRRAVSSATSPLAGVIQLSMVLNDQSFDKMTHGEWTETLAPKVQGTWNLHHATETQPLDFFIMAGSASGVMGNAGQANYAAANTFLEGFGMYRHSKGLPASVLNLGIVGDAGFVYEKFDRILELARKAHQEILEEKDILKALEIHMANGNPQLSIGLCSTKPDLAHESTSSFGHDARLLAGYNMLTTQEEDGASEDNELRALLASMKRDPALLYDPATEEKITLEIGRMVAKGTSHSDDLSPEELGEIAIDSLMTIEIRSWFRRHVNIEVSLAEISNAGTARGLGATTMRILREKHKSGELGAVKERLADSEANDVDQPTTYQEDTKLAASLQPISTSVPSWYANSEGRVFLTGSTGFMGIFFLSLLVGLPEVQQVVCLVRGPDVSTGVSRLKESSKKYGLQFDLESKVIVVPGDVSDPTFNLGQDNFEHYAQWASVVFHFAACTDYTFPYADIRRANVHGWLNVLRFSNTKRLKQVHLTSSISAYGTTAYLDGEELIPENDRPVMNNVESMQHHVGYSQSKAVVETMAWDAIANGMPVIIHRLPLVTGHSRTGRGKSNGVFSILMATSIRLGCYPTSPDARCQMVPVDFVCAAILRISQSNCGSHAFNIVQPDQAQTPTWDETMQMVAQHASPPLRRVERSEWIEAFATGGKPRFQKASSMLDESIRRIDALWQTDGMGKTLYENANFCSVLAESPEFSEWPSTPDLLSLYFKDWSNRATQW